MDILDTPDRGQRMTEYEAMMAELETRFDDEAGYMHRPVDWVRERADEYLWSTQREIVNSVRDNRYTAVPSCHDSGKSYTASRIMGWWMDAHPTGSAFVISTAPTAAQVSAILWRELNRLKDKAEIRGKINRAGYPQWYMGNSLVGYGRKPSDYDESAFQGIHDEYILVIVDEAGGIKKHLFDAVDALATNENARVLAIGNPDDPGSHFASICKESQGWNVIQIDGLMTPNFTEEIIMGKRWQATHNPDDIKYPLTYALMQAEGIPFNTEDVPHNIRPLLLSPLWVEERIWRWGGVTKGTHLNYSQPELQDLVQRRCATSPLFQAKVRGQFPDSRSTGVLPLGWVQQAVNRHNDWLEACDKANRNGKPLPHSPGRRVVGIDPAYLGDEGDETAISVRQGDIVEKLVRFRDADTVETSENALPYLDAPHAMAVVDVIGIGAGVVSELRRLRREGLHRADVIQFNAGASSQKRDRIGALRFRNDRAAAWWNLREMLDPSRDSKVAIPDDAKLIEELVTVKTDNLEGGIIKIESKDDIRKRLGRSTDAADAVVQSFWVPGEMIDSEAHDNAWHPRASPVDQAIHDVYAYNGYNAFTDEDFGIESAGDTIEWDTLNEYGY